MLSIQKFFMKTFLVFLLFFSLRIINPTLAQYFPNVPSTPNIVRETPIIVSYTQPQKIITIDITQFDPNQVVKKITITLKEAELSASLKIDLLRDRPPDIPEPEGSALLYFTSRAPEEICEKTEKAEIIFVIKKSVIEERRVKIETITLNRFSKGTWRELPTRMVDEDEKFLYFEAEGSGMFHFAATGIVVSPLLLIWSQDSSVLAAVVIVFMVVLIFGIFLRWW